MTALPVDVVICVQIDEAENIDHPFEPIETTPEAQVAGIGFGRKREHLQTAPAASSTAAGAL